ncbi:MAG: glycine/sarcosine/betaine reductase selenoprotein B family protein [Fidelibacterota bacterium]
MGDWAEFSPAVRTYLRLYPWRRIRPVPWATLSKPLNQSKVAIVTTAGLVLPDQEEFDPNIKGGDYTHRVIPVDVELKTLKDTHRSRVFDHNGYRSDPNLAFPLDRLREFQEDKIIGSVSSRHISLMGSITAPGRLKKLTAPKVANLFLEDGVDAVLLFPV